MSERAAETPGTVPAAVPGTLTLEDIAGLMRDMPKPKLRALHAHPLVVTWLRIMSTEAEPAFPGAIGGLTGIPVIEKPELGPGEWELYEDGEMIKSGRLGR